MKLQARATALKCLLLATIAIGCKPEASMPVEESDTSPSPVLVLSEANRLAALPFHCMEVEYPNKPGETLAGPDDVMNPKGMHPAFYGCFDWHSSVHGHWSLVSLMKQFPELDNRDSIRQKLKANINPESIAIETAYFSKSTNLSFERTYGWAWLLKLAQELHTWDDPDARELEASLEPLTKLIAGRYLTFLPKLKYPIRVGEHTNTAFGLSFALDYAVELGDTALVNTIHEAARRFYFTDKDCPMNWEPSGYDFLSPCLEEADLMRRVLSPDEFDLWLAAFMPQLSDLNYTLEPGVVSDRSDGKLVHLDGLNFSRAWCLYGLASSSEKYSHLRKLADKHIAFSLPSIVDQNYEGTHWLGSFAIYALQEGQK